MLVNNGTTLSVYNMYITKHNLQYYFLIESAQLSCSHFPFLCRKGGWGNIFPRVHQLEGVFAVRTNVSMGDLVVAIPLFSCCFFHTSSFFYMCTHITTRQSCVSSSCIQVGLQMFGVHTMINRGHFILLLLQPPCLLWSPVMFRCILSSNCLTE